MKLPKPRTLTRQLGLPLLAAFAAVNQANTLQANVPSQASSDATYDPVDRVNVFAGTSNSRWMLFPGAALPFGMVKLSPDNQLNVWNGGYEYSVSSISGFSHLHGMSLSGLSIMPVTGTIQADPSSSRFHPGNPDGPFRDHWTAGYRSRIDKETETGAPGYYAADLVDYGVKAELSSTERCGFLRFTYPETDKAHIFVDFDFPTEEKTEVSSVQFSQTGPAEFSGRVVQKNGYVGTHSVHFVMELSIEPSSVEIWQNKPYQGSNTNYGTAWRRPSALQPLGSGFEGAGGSGAIIHLPPTQAGQIVTVRTALSFVSIENARLNLHAEALPFGWDFDSVVEAAKEKWRRLLSTIYVSDERPQLTDAFYTSVYRAYSGKCLLNDVNGEYIDMNKQLARLDESIDYVYSGDAFWGAQWNLFPLWTLATPSYAVSHVNSLIALAERGGWIPQSPTGLTYSPIMTAQHQNALIISSYQKGLRDFDYQKAYDLIRHDLTTPGVPFPEGGFAGNRHLEPYLKYGYVPEEYGPVSNTLEYAFDDWCFAQFAKALGKQEDFETFSRRSESWRNVFDRSVGFVRRRHSDGNWVEGFDPLAYGTKGGWNGPGFVEGDSWVYTWFIPHNLDGLLKEIGQSTFNSRLEEGFAKKYVHLGNQPNLQAPFLFNYSGKPWRTQAITRNLVDSECDNSPNNAWHGEEDEGQMGALYALQAMGLFQMKSGCSVSPYYDLSSPAFQRVEINLDSDYYPGNRLLITSNATAENVYIQSVTFNGKHLDEARISHDALVSGGTLHFELSENPNRDWPRAKSELGSEK